MAKQYGFYFDADRCVQCHACEVACKSVNNIEPGPRWRRGLEFWGGEFPQVTRTFFSLACMHCEKPTCAEACPEGAISKRDEDGVVIVDKEKCNGCQACADACLFGVPQFGKDGTMQKCDYCLGLGQAPVCAGCCPAEALVYGSLAELTELASKKSARRLEGSSQPVLFIRGENSILHKALTK